MVNLLDYRTNSDYDATAQIKEHHMALTIPAGTYTEYYTNFSTTSSVDVSNAFVDAVWKFSNKSSYYQSVYAYIRFESGGQTANLSAAFKEMQGSVELVAVLERGALSNLVLNDPITIDLWLKFYKMPF